MRYWFFLKGGLDRTLVCVCVRARAAQTVDVLITLFVSECILYSVSTSRALLQYVCVYPALLCKHYAHAILG